MIRCFAKVFTLLDFSLQPAIEMDLIGIISHAYTHDINIVCRIIYKLKIVTEYGCVG